MEPEPPLPPPPRPLLPPERRLPAPQPWHPGPWMAVQIFTILLPLTVLAAYSTMIACHALTSLTLDGVAGLARAMWISCTTSAPVKVDGLHTLSWAVMSTAITASLLGLGWYQFRLTWLVYQGREPTPSFGVWQYAMVVVFGGLTLAGLFL